MQTTDIPSAMISKAKISKWTQVGWIFRRESHRTFVLCLRIELVELETALNDIEKAMDKIETQNSNIQNKLRDLLESNRQVAKEFSEIRRGMTTKLKDVTQQMEQAPGIAHDLAAVTSDTLSAIEQDMSSTNETAKFKWRPARRDWLSFFCPPRPPILSKDSVFLVHMSFSRVVDQLQFLKLRLNVFQIEQWVEPMPSKTSIHDVL